MLLRINLKFIFVMSLILLSGCREKAFDCSKADSKVINQLFVDCINSSNEWYNPERKTIFCKEAAKELMCEEITDVGRKN